MEFEKSVLTTAITIGNLGLANQAKTFQGKRGKESIIYLDKLPNSFVKEIVKGNGIDFVAVTMRLQLKCILPYHGEELAVLLQ